MSGLIEPNVPAAGKMTFLLAPIGCGLLPLYGSSIRPTGSCTMVRFPKGGDEACVNHVSPGGVSYANAYEDRTAIRPSPNTSQATPTRGETFSHWRLKPERPTGNPESPGYSMPAGALMNCRLLT